MIYYSNQFYADRVSLLCADLNIPEKYKDQLSQYTKFWRSTDRIKKFATLGIENYNPETIEIGLLAVMAGVKTPSFEEVLKTVIISGEYVENKYITALDKLGLLKGFWHLCEKYYGYNEEKPTLEKLVVTLLITYTAHCFNGDLPKSWQPFSSYKKNDIAVFVSNLMNNMLYKDQFDLIAKQIAAKIRVNDYFKNAPVESYFECDTFIKVKTGRYKKEVGYVEVVLTSLSRKITNLITYIDFIQTENVSDTLQSIKVKVYFESESGKKISDEVIIIADKKNAPAEKRQFHEKFTFRNRRYTKDEKYYLVMKDAISDMEISRHEFIIDIAFADDFGFSL